jgi:hypothetical protein
MHRRAAITAFTYWHCRRRYVERCHCPRCWLYGWLYGNLVKDRNDQAAMVDDER